VFPLALAAFFCFGIVLVIVGANQAGLERDLGLDLAQTGLLAATLSLGIFAGVVGAGPLYDRFPRRPLFVAACTIAGAGFLAIGADTPFAGICALLAVIGLGTGGYDTLFNASIVERFGESAAKPMSIMHAATTIGAVLCPALVAAIASRWHWTRSFHLIGMAHLLLAVVSTAVRFPAPTSAPKRALQHAAFHTERNRRTIDVARLLPFALIAFAYVGLEGTLTVFAVPYATDGLSLSTARGQAGISAFWFGLLIGRLAPLLLPIRLEAPALVVAGLAGALVLGGGVALAEDIEVTLGLCGVATGCVYPVMISLVGQRFPRARGTAAGLAAGAGAIGGLTIPWLTGIVGDGFGIASAIATMTLWSVVITIGGFAAGRPEPATG